MAKKAHERLIILLGDTAIVAKQYRKTKGTVSGWKTRGIPLPMLIAMLKDAKKAKKKIPKEFKELFI